MKALLRNSLICITFLAIFLNSPFGNIYGQEKKSFIQVNYNILNFGAVNDSSQLSTTAINRAIDVCSENGGGRVIVPSGRYRSGTIFMKSNVELFLESGAYLYASKNKEDFPRQPQVEYRSLLDASGWYSFIYAANKSNFSITGLGTIDGQGSGKKGIAEGLKGDVDGRPRNILFISCKNINVSGITLLNSAMWNQHYLDCEDVMINNIRVYNHCNRNNDGIDIDGCRRFFLSNSIIDSNDDGITLKSTGTAPCKDVVINNCVVSSLANGIKCGTESTGGFKNIIISNCVIKPTLSNDKPFFEGAGHGITGISLEIVDGGIMDGVTINNIMIEGTECPLYVRLGNRARKHIEAAPTPPPGQMRNIQISNVMAYRTGNYSASITGVPPAKIENIFLDNIHFFNEGGLIAGNYLKANGFPLNMMRTNFRDKYLESYAEVPEDEKAYPQPTGWKNLPSFGLFIRHVNNISVTNSSFVPSGAEPRIPVIAIDVEYLVLKNIHTVVDKQAAVQLKDVKKYSMDKELSFKVEK
jgi:Glycosyl hydrolases family 28